MFLSMSILICGIEFVGAESVGLPRMRAGPDTTSTTTSTTTSAYQMECGAVTQCLDNVQCRDCLSAINATRGYPHVQTDFSRLSAVEVHAYVTRPWLSLRRCYHWTKHSVAHLDMSSFVQHTHIHTLHTHMHMHTHSHSLSDIVAMIRFRTQFFQSLRSTVSCWTNATPAYVINPALEELNSGVCIGVHGMVTTPCLVAEYVLQESVNDPLWHSPPPSDCPSGLCGKLWNSLTNNTRG